MPGPRKATVEDGAGEGTLVASHNENLHGNAPDKANAALLLIDVINDLEFPEGEQLLRHALPMAERLVALKRRAKAAAIPVVYVNDNFGRWRSNFTSQVEHCLNDGVRGRPLVELLLPDPVDYFVLKPKHSGFFSTTLDLWLEYLGIKTVILNGDRGESLRALHGERRLHARLLPDRTARLRGVQHRGGQRQRPGADAESPQGGHSPVDRIGSHSGRRGTGEAQPHAEAIEVKCHPAWLGPLDPPCFFSCLSRSSGARSFGSMPEAP